LRHQSENRAEGKSEATESDSKKSFEIDPTLKELGHTLKDKCSKLRKEEVKYSDEGILTGDHPSLNLMNPSFYADVIKDAPELQIDFKGSLTKIATTFNRVFVNLKDHEKANHEVNELLVENFFLVAKTLALAIEARDPYTGGHSDRVFQMATEIGRRCNLKPLEQMYLEGGALLHDVGKIAIRDGVLLKPGPLTDLEYKEMQLHTIFGAQIIKRLSCLQGCVDVVLLHHERMDGYGYPYGLKGNEIPLAARITSVVDAYDAMTTNRIYRKALSHEQGIEEIIRNSGTQFDPEIVKVFVKWWEEKFQNTSAKRKAIYRS
jgi:HD-GYP domain-containing protein (c-di-GMP phosphodiesterase class II)